MIRTAISPRFAMSTLFNTGHSLPDVTSTSERAHEQRLLTALAGARFGDVRWVEATGSTNDDLVAEARRGAGEQVLVSDLQTQGRGRRDRRWHAPPRSSLMMSLLVRNVDPKRAFWAVGAVALAATEAAQAVTGVHCSLKWPNDVLIGDRKVAGVLAQIVGDAAIVGIGMNTGWPEPMPAEIAERATSLNHHTSGSEATVEVDRAALAIELLSRVEVWLDSPDALLRSAWSERCATIGATVRVETAGSSVTGIAASVDHDGALLVTVDGSIQRFDVAEVVHLRRQGDDHRGLQ